MFSPIGTSTRPQVSEKVIVEAERMSQAVKETTQYPTKRSTNVQTNGTSATTSNFKLLDLVSNPKSLLDLWGRLKTLLSKNILQSTCIMGKKKNHHGLTKEEFYTTRTRLEKEVCSVSVLHKT